MSSAQSSISSWAARWRDRVERMAQHAPARAVRRLAVGEGVEGELRVIDAARTTSGMQLRAPVLLLELGAGLTGVFFTPYGWKGFIGGALIGWVLGARIYAGAVPYGLSDPRKVRFAAEDLVVGNWLLVRRGGLVRRAARVTRLEDGGATVRATLSNGQAKEWPWRRRVSGLVLLELPWPLTCGPRTRCLYALADEELPAAWALPRCGGPPTWSLGAQRLCDDHAAWATRVNPGLWLVRDAADDTGEARATASARPTAVRATTTWREAGSSATGRTSSPTARHGPNKARRSPAEAVAELMRLLGRRRWGPGLDQ